MIDPHYGSKFIENTEKENKEGYARIKLRISNVRARKIF